MSGKTEPRNLFNSFKSIRCVWNEVIILEDSLTGARAANNAQIAFAIVPDSSSKKTTKTPDNLEYLRVSGTDLKVIEKWLLESNFHV
jgi:beta-phosphoglucomutase-like phosphatase (HAD superfamily)